jgi:prolyl-tRNA synthetase
MPNDKRAKKSENFSEWYTSVLIDSGFIDYSPVSGMIVFRPDSYFAWEIIRDAVDTQFKKSGIQNVYFPLLIPEKLLEKEKEHVEGFSPEVAWVTHAGKSKLDERLAIRPTSETIMYEVVKKWIKSWRDLPLRMNQWNNVVRWEFKHPTPFLRSREFLWNEGHTIFATKEEADAERDEVLGIYERVLKDYIAMPGIPGRKTDYEKFAGAEASYSIEHIMPDGWMIQGPDFHIDGQKFSKAFGITFLDKDGNSKFAYQNTFAISTRELGVLIAVHGDDRGMILPPKIARIQAVIIPIYNSGNKAVVLEKANEVYASIRNKVRAYIDDNDAYSPGWKFNEWELKGVPIRIELGEKETKSGKVSVVRRDTLEKTEIPISELHNVLPRLLNEIHNSLYNRAKKYMEAHIHEVEDFKKLSEIMEKSMGAARAPWCGSHECEMKIKEDTGAKIANMPFDAQSKAKGKKCILCGKEAKYIADFARSY